MWPPWLLRKMPSWLSKSYVNREFLLTPLVRFRGHPQVSGPSSPYPHRKLLEIDLYAALFLPTPAANVYSSGNVNRFSVSF